MYNHEDQIVSVRLSDFQKIVEALSEVETALFMTDSMEYALFSSFNRDTFFEGIEVINSINNTIIE